MNKVAHYLQQHLSGEVLSSPDVLEYFSTDESILKVRPLLVAHPRNENDLRKTARFSWQLAERGRVVPITMRGKGTDQTGASLGNGIILSMPAHMHKIIELDPKSGIVTVEAGINAGKLQQTLHTHGRFLPSLKDSLEYTTIGGAIANNEAGPSSYKYGPIREHVTGLRVILANGEMIQTRRLSKRELNKKLGLSSFEGEIYRAIDKLIEESHETVESLGALSDRSNVGYDIADVKRSDGSFDLTPLFVGSQGTLGLISEITLATHPHNPQTELMVAMFESREDAFTALVKINDMKQGPAIADFVDSSVIDFIQRHNPSLLKDTIGSQKSELVLYLYLEESAGLFSRRSKKALMKILNENNADVVVSTEENRDKWEASRTSFSLFTGPSNEALRPIPIVHDAFVPIESCAAFIAAASRIVIKYSSNPYVIWGQAGSGIIHTASLFDVSAVGDRQKMFKMQDEYYSLVTSYGGSIAASNAEGRITVSQLHKVLTNEQIILMKSIKKICDPFMILNPGVKISIDSENVKTLVRTTYTLEHQYSYLPRA